MLHPIVCKQREPLEKVASVIDSTSATWRVDFLEEHFIPMDVDVILQNPNHWSNTYIILVFAL
jgi:hypothetical protein